MRFESSFTTRLSLDPREHDSVPIFLPSKRLKLAQVLGELFLHRDKSNVAWKSVKPVRELLAELLHVIENKSVATVDDEFIQAKNK